MMSVLSMSVSIVSRGVFWLPGNPPHRPDFFKSRWWHTYWHHPSPATWICDFWKPPLRPSLDTPLSVMGLKQNWTGVGSLGWVQWALYRFFGDFFNFANPLGIRHVKSINCEGTTDTCVSSNIPPCWAWRNTSCGNTSVEVWKDKRIVNIMKVYIERNNLQVEYDAVKKR